MSTFSNFVDNEQTIYSNLFLEISQTVDQIEPFISKETLHKRRYYLNKNTIKEYLDILDAAEKDVASKGFFKKSAAEETNLTLVRDYKSANASKLEGLTKCTDCMCFSCVTDCSFDSCNACKNGGYVGSCDKSRSSVFIFDNTYKLDLLNNDTGTDERFNVVGIVQDVLKDKRYILMQNLITNQNVCLYLNYTLRGQDYGEILDGDEFDYAIEAYELAASEG